ncbi:hypothetical protein BBJ28_00023001 [Nothophytophthora sp. Chile5]|nr:hypothetical protein BBJ28_00023001 [Nothophytophthora sp. Chile5]
MRRPVLVRRDEGTGVRILFQTQTWSAPHIHYLDDSGSWTTTPGVAMRPSSDAEYAADDGWFQFDRPSASTLTFVFNDGVGEAWDNNQNANYQVAAAGVYTVASILPVFSTGDRTKPDDGTGFHILFQPKSWAQPYFHFSNGERWTTVPGFAMVASTHAGIFSATNGWFQYHIAPTAASTLKIAFNDGNGVWDSNSGANYKLETRGTYAFVNQTPQDPHTYVTGQGYHVTSAKELSGVLTLDLALNPPLSPTPYGEDLAELVVIVTQTQRHMVHVKITDKNAQRWEVPATLFPRGTLGGAPTRTGGGLLYSFSYTESPFTFCVVRKADGYTIFDSSAVPLVVKDQYLQVATAVGSDLSVYGLGESTREHFKMATGAKETLWARDQGSMTLNVNTYGSHPFFMGVNALGKAHGVLLLNSNGMDVTLESDMVVYQTIGGVLDFSIMVGPEPAQVISQYTTLIGKPKLMPYWSYGFHQCRWGYKSVNELHDVVAKYADSKIPLDAIWADIDYMHNFHDFTLDPINFKKAEMQELMAELRRKGQKFVPIVDPGIPNDKSDYAYTKGLELDIFIKATDGEPYVGRVWPGTTVFPDFLHPKATEYWEEQLRLTHQSFAFDGLWIDMNELSNFDSGLASHRNPKTAVAKIETITAMTGQVKFKDDENRFDHPPFAINNGNCRDGIYQKTISASALQYDGTRQYDCHNLYGLTEAIATCDVMERLTAKRSFVLSRSTFPGSGVHTAHWTGDNASTWNDLRWSIPTILKFGLFGIPMVGADIGGFAGSSTMELCARWTALGSFYPFARNHNIIKAAPQETYVWPEVVNVGQKFIGMRYQLLPYIYTLGYHAHADGTPIARPLLLEFPSDANSHAIDRQFMLGDALLVTPVLEEGATSVTGYYPAGVWYDIFDYSRIQSSSGTSVATSVSLYDMPVHIRGGTIVAMHQPALTSVAARLTPFDLLVALPVDGSAAGEVFLDDGEQIAARSFTTVVFTASPGSFSSTVLQHRYPVADASLVSKVIVLGVKSSPSSVSFGSIKLYDPTTQRLEISLDAVRQSIASDFSLTWE